MLYSTLDTPCTRCYLVKAISPKPRIAFASPFRQIHSPSYYPSRRSSTLYNELCLYRPPLHATQFRVASNSWIPARRHLSQSTPPDNGALAEQIQLAFQKPMKQLTATCKVCKHRATHQFSKQAYDHGTILITCPSCKNRHLIADNLKIFRDEKTNLEDLMREKGEVIRKGVISAVEGLEGDVEVVEEDGKLLVRGDGPGTTPKEAAG